MKLSSIDFREVKPTLRLALPIVAGNLSGVLTGWVDTLMVGHLGVVPLAAVAFAGTISMFFYFIGAGSVLPVALRAAQAHAARDIPALANWLSASLIIILIVGTLTTIGALAFVKFLPLLGQDPRVVQACTGYYICTALSLMPNLLWLGLKTFLDALRRPWIGFWVLIASVGLDGFFNWLFIFGNWGFPRWEVTGAGFATLLTRILGATCMVLIFLSTPSLRRLLFRISTWSWTSVRTLLRAGMPIASQMLSESVAFNIAAIMIGWLGAVPLAAHQIAITMAGTTNMIPLGVGTALIIRMGNLLGAEENKRLACAAYSTILTTCTFMGCIGTLVMLFSHSISDLFVHSEAVHQITTQLLIILGFLQITDALYILSQSALRGLADIHFPTFINLFVYLGFGVACAFLLGIAGKLQAPGIWLGLCLGSALNGLLCFWRLRKKIAISLQA